MLTINASSLRTFQQCRRKLLLERAYRVIRWRPKTLFSSCLRDGVFALSNGTTPAIVVSNARTRFLSQAANPGLDLPSGDPWTVAQDWAGMLGTSLTAISRTTLLSLARPESLPLSPSTSWLPSTFLDESHTLHRWIVVSALDEETVSRELHSWSTIADMVMYDAPLTLHAVVIGSTRSGRRQSPWVRCYKHPVIAGQFRFQRPDGKGGWRSLSGDHWSPVWYSDQTSPDPETWVDLLESDGVIPSLIHHLSVAQPSATNASRCKDEILRLVEHSASLSGNPMDEPMSRNACDPVGGPCQWQHACYRGTPDKGIEDLGLYQIRALP